MTTELDLLTANLWGLPWPVARERRARKRRFTEHLTRRPYDLVGIQELWWPWRRTLQLSVDDDVHLDSILALTWFDRAAGDVHARPVGRHCSRVPPGEPAVARLQNGSANSTLDQSPA